MDKKEGEKTILVFDLGGGTFDVSLLTVDNGFFEVIATNGDTHLGGEDFDQRVMEHFMKLYKKKTGKDVRGDIHAVQKLRREVEKGKRALSFQHQARIEIESFYGGEDFSETLTRARFEELNMVSSYSCDGFPFQFVHSSSYVYILVCLLYTSPSPRDATLSRMPSSA